MQEYGANQGNKMAHRNFYGNSSVFFTKRWQNERKIQGCTIASEGKYAEGKHLWISLKVYLNWLQEVKGLKAEGVLYTSLVRSNGEHS